MAEAVDMTSRQGDVVDCLSWSMPARIGFRFAVLFWVLAGYNGVDLVMWFWPWLNLHLSHWLEWPFQRMALWSGAYVFHLAGEAATRHSSGSGDKALDWIETLCVIVVSGLGCAVWSAVSEWRGRRREYSTLYAWLRLVLRFSLAAALLGYGFEKVFPLQMPPPSAAALAETYGASSPMHLAWTFIGASTTYRVFAGLAEVIPAVLLLFRRTSTAGALGAAAVMLNVWMMNMGYDIPVKLYSFELMLIAVFLLLPDMLPMWRFFLQRTTSALTGVWVRRPERRALRVAAVCLQVAVTGNLLYGTAWSSWKSWRGANSALKGVWTIDSAEGVLAAEHWRSISALYAGYLVMKGDGDPAGLDVKIDDKDRTVEFLHTDDDGDPVGKPYAELRWTDEGGGKMTLSGSWKGQPGSLAMHRDNPPPTLLMTRGFHWVQEYPLNK